MKEKDIGEILKEKGIEPRQIIFELIDHIAADYIKNITNENKDKKIFLFHLALAEISDEEIMTGLKTMVDDPSPLAPNAGKFKKGCVRPPRLKIFNPVQIENEQTPAEIKATEDARDRFFEKIKGDQQ